MFLPRAAPRSLCLKGIERAAIVRGKHDPAVHRDRCDLAGQAVAPQFPAGRIRQLFLQRQVQEVILLELVYIAYPRSLIDHTGTAMPAPHLCKLVPPDRKGTFPLRAPRHYRF
jgi:hypothetical protein